MNIDQILKTLRSLSEEANKKYKNEININTKKLDGDFYQARYYLGISFAYDKTINILESNLGDLK